jgi:cytochrome-b5 reductase
MSTFEGTFDPVRIDMCQTLVLIAAGTGLTPMIRLINYAFQQTDSKPDISILLLFFNKTQNDILCRDELQTISNKHKYATAELSD